MDNNFKREILSLVEENNLSNLKMIIQESLILKENDYLLKILSLVEAVLGNFENSLILLKKIKLKNIIEKDFESFILETVKNKYIPIYNKLLEKIELKEGIEDIEDIARELEEIYPNVLLYRLLSLYYLDIQLEEKSKIYIEKALKLDKNNIEILEIKNYLLENQNSKKKTLNKKISIKDVFYSILKFDFINKK